MTAQLDQSGAVHLGGLTDQVGTLTPNTAEELARARALVERVAPDLVGAVFGDE